MLVTERLVDVKTAEGQVLHTFPVTIATSGVPANDGDYEEKALTAAAHAQIVPDAELKSLTSKMHVSRGGRLEPYGDNLEVLSQTNQGLDQAIRERAYLLWEADGCQEGGADDYWHRARDHNLRERAYVLWQQDGSPAGRAEDHWHRTCEFEL
jgi:Protein of unknown function (DUF2934)